METILRGLLMMATAGALVFPAPQATVKSASASRGRVVAPAPTKPTAASFAATQVEAYLSDDGIAYVRPGVKIKVNSITNVAAGKKPVVDFNLTDQFDQPLDRNGKITPGPIAPGFILSQWNPDTRYYKTFTLRTRNGVTAPAGDQGGTFTDMEMGHYKYNFGTTMPSDLSSSATLTLGIYARRTLADIIGKDYYADNVLMDFRPDGGTPTATWGAMAVATTCNKCHDPLGLHGGTRRDVELCMQCHNDQINNDATSGQTFNGKVFFHKLHMGSNLPSVQAGGTYYAGGDWSTVVFPQDIRNCTTCHDPKAPEANIWQTRPTRAVCGSCHDSINWTTGAGHVAGAMADDSACAKCHVPSSGVEWDASVQGAHTVEYKSTQLHGLTMKILSVAQAKPGQAPIVKFQINDKKGAAIDPRPIDTLRFTLAGPTTDYSNFFSENALPTVTFDGTTSTYAFKGTIPANAVGTWMLTCDVEWTVPLKQGDGKPDNTNFTESPLNPIYYLAMTDKAPVPRRSVVSTTNCNQCHDRIAGHGGQRLIVDECFVCHNPVTDDSASRGATAGAAENINLQRMIHKIHTGENLTQTFTIFHGRRSVNYNDVRFSGDTRDCAKCHLGATYTLPAGGVLSTVTKRDYFSPQGPGTAACLGCHDNADAAAHAYLNTTNFGGSGTPAEACATCHGAGKDWGVDKVHAR